MGICSSCLGLHRRHIRHESPETSRLLYDDPPPNQYGTANGGASQGVVQIDPLDAQREEAAAQKILAQTSDHLIDVFALQSPVGTSTLPSGVVSSEDAKRKRYQALLQQVLSANIIIDPDGVASEGKATSSHSDPATSDEELVSELRSVKRDNVGDLVAGFGGWQGANRLVKEFKG